MTTAQNDIPKMHLVWYSTGRGTSNEDGSKQRLYYGKIFRVPRAIVAEKERLGIEDREFADLEKRFIDTNCVDGGMPAIGEAFERYDVFDPDTDEVIVMYRVPYKPSDELASRPSTTLPPLSRHARRAAAKQGHFVGGIFAVPPNTSGEARQLMGRLLRLLTKHAPDNASTLPAALAAEQRALALITVAAYELSSMPPSPQRQAIITQMGAFLGWLVDQTDSLLPMPTISKEDAEELIEEGIATPIGLGPNDVDKMN